MLAAVAHNATSITVFDGIIKATSCLDPKGLIRLELSGKRPLGPAGALQLGQALADSATPSALTALDVRFVFLNSWTINALTLCFAASDLPLLSSAPILRYLISVSVGIFRD